MSRRERAVPAAWVSTWPGEPQERAARADVEVARQVALGLAAAKNGRSAREISRLTGVAYTTVLQVERGTGWADMVTIARLEAGLGVTLWPAGLARDMGRVPDGDDSPTDAPDSA